MPADSTRPAWPFKDITKMAAHPRGIWVKKIKGKVRYFGKWRDPDPDNEWARAALRRYLAFVQADQDDAAPLPLVGDVTVELLVNHWLQDRREAMEKGALTARQYLKYKRLGVIVVETLGRERAVNTLGPADMKRLRDTFKGGAVWVGSQVRWTRGMFNWGREYYRVMPAYGGMFKAPAKSTVRKERKEFRPFTASELRGILAATSGAVKCFVLLGLNCGFGQSDCSRLLVSAVDFKKKMIHYPRGKTGVERRCPLWPETIKALQEYQRPNLMRPELFFVTRFGLPYVSEKKGVNDAGELVRASRSDSVYQEFALAQMLVAGVVKNRYERIRDGIPDGFKPRGFYVLRHMFRSIAEETGKINAIRVIMGQSFPGLDEYYLHLKVGKYRDLRVVTDAVRRWVFSRK